MLDSPALIFFSKGERTMSKIIDITDKLNFEENPKIKVKDVELEINASAENMVKVMALASDDSNVKNIVEMCNFIFTKSSKKKLDSLKLNFQDFTSVVNIALDVAVGNDEEENVGE